MSAVVTTSAPVRVLPLRWPLPLLGGVVLAGYLAWTPQVPDLAAQVARAEAVRRGGPTVWWPGWYGGLQTPGYSATTPALMAVLGVTLTGALAVLVTVAVGPSLFRGARHPVAGTAGLLATSVADVVDGRITFAVSLALGCCCLAELRRADHRRRPVLLGSLALLTCASSPLGGLFLGLAAITCALVDRRRRAAALLVAATLVLAMGTLAALFPDSGRMPVDARWVGLAVASAALVALTCRIPAVQIGVLLYLGLVLAFVLVPLGVGSNSTRLAWMLALPLVAAYGQLPRALLPAALCAAAVFPAVDLAGQLSAAEAPASSAEFFAPLGRALAADRSARPASTGERLEVIDPRGHWATVYLSDQQLARGWERQVDRSQNPLFYGLSRLDAGTYRAWLDSLAVGWVALPAGPLDYASAGEAALVRGGLDYLEPIWTNRDWTLFRVRAARPLAEGATVRAVDDEAVVISAERGGPVRLAVRWSPYLVVTDALGHRAGEVRGDGDGMTVVELERGGTFRVTADFDGSLVRRLRTRL